MRANRTIRNNCKGVGAAQNMKLCDECTGNMFWRDGVGYRCSSCPNTSYVIVKESEAADFRRDVAAATELKEMLDWELAAAIYKIDAPEEQVDAFLKMTNRAEWDPFYLDTEPTADDLREVDEWLSHLADPDPRTEAQKALDDWQADASATRRMDEPR